MSERVLIVNADDFGASRGINEGIVHCHVHGVLTSASLMVHGKAAAEAVALARGHPALGLGLHWDLDSKDAPKHDLQDADAVKLELARQLAVFAELVGAMPTHIDSHHHVHRLPHISRIARELAEPVGVPLRDDGRVTYIGGFYGQWEYLVTDLHYISPEFLIEILRDDVLQGWTEIGCHPGYVTGDYRSAYLVEREVELNTLTDPQIAAEIAALDIRLANYRDFLAS